MSKKQTNDHISQPLNDSLRMEILENIKKGLPKVDEAAIVKEIVEKVRAAWPKDVRAFDAKYPGTLRTMYLPWPRYGVNVWDLPPVANNMLLDKQLVTGPLDGETVSKLLSPYEAAHAARQQVIEKLHSALKGYRNTKALLKNFPEFASCVPSGAAPNRSLPAHANLIADLSKLGWPDEKKE